MSIKYSVYRRSFTLVELLISIAIITMLAATALFTLYGVLEHAKEVRTRTQIAKLHEMLMDRWDSYLSRPVRLSSTAGLTPRAAVLKRLWALRELMRMELPDRITDVKDRTPAHLAVIPSLANAYTRAVDGALGNTNWYVSPQPQDGSVAAGKWSYIAQGSECLYLIVSQIHDGDRSGIEFFQKSEIGDTDGDGMKEILDGWGRPIEFMRWAPGFATNPGPDGQWGIAGTDDNNDSTTDNPIEIGYPGSDDSSDVQSRDASTSPDPFDPLKVDPIDPLNLSNLAPRPTYALIPLIYSAGKDGSYGVEAEIDIDDTNDSPTKQMDLFHYSLVVNDPYIVTTFGFLGRPTPTTSADNISNHTIDTN